MLKSYIGGYILTVIKFKNFINLTQEEKELVLSWRNSDRVRLKMEHKEIISLEEHLKFIDSLKERKDCKYWLFMIDNVPVGVYDIVHLNSDGTGGVGGSYIGNEDYQGYGLLLVYLTLDMAKLTNDPPKKEDAVYVMKNNKRTYLMHKNIFRAKDLCEDDEKWYIYWTKDGWDEIRQSIKEIVYDPLNIENVIWQD